MAAAVDPGKRWTSKNVVAKLQDQVVMYGLALNALQHENRLLRQRHAVLQRLLLEVDALGWALNTPDAPAGEDSDDEAPLPSLATSSTVRSLLALQHTHMLLSGHGVELGAVDPAHRPLITWMSRPAALRAELQRLTPAQAREWYRDCVCDAALKLKLLRCRVEVAAVEAQLEKVTGVICARLLGMLLWRTDLVAELGTRGLMAAGGAGAGGSAGGGGAPASSAAPAAARDLWRRVAERLCITRQQAASVLAAEVLLSEHWAGMPEQLARLLQQHLVALAQGAVDAQQGLIDAMQQNLRTWHGALVVQLLFCYATLTPRQLAMAAADAYPAFFCEGALVEQLLVVSRALLASAPPEGGPPQPPPLNPVRPPPPRRDHPAAAAAAAAAAVAAAAAAAAGTPPPPPGFGPLLVQPALRGQLGPLQVGLARGPPLPGGAPPVAVGLLPPPLRP